MIKWGKGGPVTHPGHHLHLLHRQRRPDRCPSSKLKHSGARVEKFLLDGPEPVLNTGRWTHPTGIDSAAGAVSRRVAPPRCVATWLPSRWRRWWRPASWQTQVSEPSPAWCSRWPASARWHRCFRSWGPWRLSSGCWRASGAGARRCYRLLFLRQTSKPHSADDNKHIHIAVNAGTCDPAGTVFGCRAASGYARFSTRYQ
jgi:hypothetical protein